MTIFLDLHVPGSPLLLPNPWDVGSARLLESLGFRALATTSSGFAATLGRRDASVTRDEALAHAASIAAAVNVPVTADLENGYADDPAGVAETVRRAVDSGLAGCSIEDFTGRPGEPIYEEELAVDRVQAAVQAAGDDLVVTARAENHLHGRDDLDDTMRRLQRFGQAGAPVLYAPGLVDRTPLATVVSSAGRPVNVLATRGVPPVTELAELGVARVSVGGAFAFAAIDALVEAATEFRDSGTNGWADASASGRRVVDDTF